VTSTFVLGIDGGSWRILDAYDLPAFGRLTESGVSGTLRSTYPPITFPAWKCLSTGKNPGKLGVFGFSNFDVAQTLLHAVGRVVPVYVDGAIRRELLTEPADTAVETCTPCPAVHEAELSEVDRKRLKQLGYME
jgi:hypothetical protein